MLCLSRVRSNSVATRPFGTYQSVFLGLLLLHSWNRLLKSRLSGCSHHIFPLLGVRRLMNLPSRALNSRVKCAGRRNAPGYALCIVPGVPNVPRILDRILAHPRNPIVHPEHLGFFALPFQPHRHPSPTRTPPPDTSSPLFPFFLQRPPPQSSD